MLKIAFDRIDVTPGENGWIGFAAPVNPQPPRDPLFARIFLLSCDGEQSLIISLDYGGLYCSALYDWRRELAGLLDIPVNRVVLHSMHQHDAPFIHVEAAASQEIPLDWSWFDTVKNNVKQAVSALPGKLQQVSEIGWSMTEVHGYASNRRVVLENGSVVPRWSRCADEKIRNQPVGLIDPMLKTLGFFGNNGELIAAWSFYATHPQVGNEAKRFSADAPGEAMYLLEKRFPRLQNSFFNGCFGNLTAGKYSDPVDLEGNIRHFGKLIADAVSLNLSSMESRPAASYCWKHEEFDFPVRHFSREDLDERAAVLPILAKTLAASQAYGREHGEKYAVEVLQIADTAIFFLSGELFVEYQLYVQGLRPDKKIAVAGNCGDAFYIGTARDLSDPKGYEVKSFCRVLPEFEELFKKTVRRILDAD